jgi:transcriptional regulator with XRE-family HTH domain
VAPSAVESPRRPASAGNNGSGTIRQGDQIFGRLVAVRRAALGLSQEDLAARMGTSQANIAGIEHGRPPSLETLERLAVALAAKSRRGPAWTSLGGRWRLAGLAIAILVPALLILNGRSGETDYGAASAHLPEAASPPPAAPEPAVRVVAHGERLMASPKEAKDLKAKELKSEAATPRQEGGGVTGEEPPRPTPNAALAPRSPAEPAPQPPSGAASPQPSGSGGPSAPLQPTGKPDGSPGTGPGGDGGSGGGGSGGSGGNGPDGTGPPGQLR